MKVYYVGILVENDSNNYDKCKIVYQTPYPFSINNYTYYDLRLPIGEYNYLKTNLKAETYSKIEDEKLISIIEKSAIKIERYSYLDHFIFELVEDTNGYYYGREILTNLLFPLTEVKDERKNIEYYYNRHNNSKIEKIFTFKNPNISRFRYIVKLREVASQSVIEKELKISTKKLKYKKHLKKVRQYYNENVFNKEIILKENKELEKQNEIPKIMEDIEYSLSILKSKNKELYHTYKEKYKILINPNNSNPSSLEDFTRLLSSINLLLVMDEEKCNNILDYLSVITNKYLGKIFAGEINYSISIDDLDVLNETFLKNKNDYTIFEQRNFINKISLLYLLVTKENIDTLNESNLENSYFKENMKSIILNLITLKDLELIKNSFNEIRIKETDISNLLNIIKNIEFNQMEKQKVLELIK